MEYFNSTSTINLNCLKAVKYSESIVQATNKAFELFEKFQYHSLFYFHNTYNFLNRTCVPQVKMKLDRITMCEFNAGLYEKSLVTATNNITFASCPHTSIVHMFLNYSLNAYTVNYNLLENFLSTLLLIHPPTVQMFKYYYSVVLDCFISITGQNVEKKNLFLYILDSLLLSLQEPGSSKPTKKKDGSNKISLDMTNQLYEASAINSCEIQRKEFVYFENLAKSAKISRSLEVLNLIYKILECDFGFWAASTEPKFYMFNQGSRPLISYIFWPEIQDIGLINQNILKLLDLYALGLRPEYSDFGIKKLISDCISLLIEIIRFSDKSEVVKYPFTGKNSNDFAREFSLKLYEESKGHFPLTKDSNFSVTCAAVVYLKPHWFNLLLRSHLLSLITNYQCLPELTDACDILEHIIYSWCKINNDSKSKQSGRHATPVNLGLVKKLKSYPSVNAKHYRGKTLLHIACEKNNAEQVRALLSIPELEINEIDDEGWTALHLAAANGSVDCVRELLRRRKRHFAADVRARGSGGETPLMRAASNSHSEICRLLLEHAGSILLEDSNENNQTAAEMTQNKELLTILRHYKRNFVRTKFSFKNFKYDESDKQTVIFMCFDLIQQYFLTYRTKEIFSYLKKSEDKSNNNCDALRGIRHCNLEIRTDLDYERFEKDIKGNIPRLYKIVATLKSEPDFKAFSWFESIFSFFKH